MASALELWGGKPEGISAGDSVWQRVEAEKSTTLNS